MKSWKSWQRAFFVLTCSLFTLVGTILGGYTHREILVYYSLLAVVGVLAFFAEIYLGFLSSLAVFNYYLFELVLGAILALFGTFYLLNFDYNKNLRRLNFFLKSIFTLCAGCGMYILAAGEISVGRGFLYSGEPFLFKSFFVVSVLILFWIYLYSFCKSFRSDSVFEQFLLILAGLMFGCLLLDARNFMLVFLALVGFNICLYSLLSLPKHPAALEAVSKYYVLGIVSVVFFLFGVLLLYFEYGSLDYNFIKAASVLASDGGARLPTLIEATGLIFIVLALLFKLSAFPGFIWAADVYEGSSLFMVSMLILSKITVFGTLVGILQVFDVINPVWGPLVSLAGLGSVVVGTFGAVLQQKVKRFLAFSSISHIGISLFAVGVEQADYVVSCGYIVSYLLANTIFLGALMCARRSDGAGVTYLSELGALSFGPASLRFCAMASIFSMAGIPPFIGFFAKYAAIAEYISVDVWWGELGFYSVLALLVYSAFNYLRLIKIMYFRTTAVELPAITIDSPLSTAGVLGLLTTVLILLPVLPFIAGWYSL